LGVGCKRSAFALGRMLLGLRLMVLLLLLMLLLLLLKMPLLLLPLLLLLDLWLRLGQLLVVWLDLEWFSCPLHMLLLGYWLLLPVRLQPLGGAWPV